MIRRPELPEHITRGQVLAALDLLGLPVNCRTLTIHATDGATLTMHARDADTGNLIRSGDDPVTLTAHVPFGAEEVSPDEPA